MKINSGAEKQHDVVKLQQILDHDNVARQDFGAIFSDHVLRNKHVHATIAKWRPFSVFIIVVMRRGQQELMYNHLNNKLIDWADALAPNNCRALLEEGINH